MCIRVEGSAGYLTHSRFSNDCAVILITILRLATHYCLPLAIVGSDGETSGIPPLPSLSKKAPPFSRRGLSSADSGADYRPNRSLIAGNPLSQAWFRQDRPSPASIVFSSEKWLYCTALLLWFGP